MPVVQRRLHTDCMQTVGKAVEVLDGITVSLEDIGTLAVSYTHLDVYKRQVYILRLVGKILYGTCTNKHHLTLSDATWDS